MSLSGRIAPPPNSGLTYYDMDLGGRITEEPDVCDFKSRLREIDPTLRAYFDKVQEEWIVVAKDKSDTEYFILADTDLGRAYERVLRGRNDAPGAETAQQFADRLEREQRELQEEDAKVFKEISAEFAERFLHALKKDGILDHDNIYGVKKASPTAARRAVRRVVDPRGPSDRRELQ